MLINEYWQRVQSGQPRAQTRHKTRLKATHLHYLRLYTLPPRDMQQVWLKREGSQADCLEGLPPFEKVLGATAVALRVDLELKLANG